MTLPTTRTGNAVLDEEHIRLSEVLSNLQELCRDHSEKVFPKIQTALLLFLDHLTAHFALEEAVLRQAGYENLPDHAKGHADLIAETTTLIKSIQGETPENPMSVLTRIEDIIFEHELINDSDYWLAISPSLAPPALEWSDSMITGIPTVDDHHKALIIQCHRLADLARDNDLEQFLTTAKLMGELTAHHFRLEESLVTSLGGQHDRQLERHIRAHAALLSVFGERVDAVATRKVDAGNFVNNFLNTWLTDHIVHTDIPHISGLIQPRQKP